MGKFRWGEGNAAAPLKRPDYNEQAAIDFADELNMDFDKVAEEYKQKKAEEEATDLNLAFENDLGFFGNMVKSWSDQNELRENLETLDETNIAEESDDAIERIQDVTNDMVNYKSSSTGYKVGSGLYNLLGSGMNTLLESAESLSLLLLKGGTLDFKKSDASVAKSLLNKIDGAATGLAKDVLNFNSKFSKTLHGEDSNTFVDRMSAKGVNWLDKHAKNVAVESKNLEIEGQKRVEDELAQRKASGEGPSVAERYSDFLTNLQSKKINRWGAEVMQGVDQMAAKKEGREIKSVTDTKDKTLSDKKIKIGDQEFPIEVNDSQNGSIWDSKKIVFDESGKPMLDKEGKPVYTSKYSFGENMVNSNYSALYDSYFLQGPGADLVGVSLAFILGGKGISAGLEGTAKGVGKITSAVAEEVNLSKYAISAVEGVLNPTVKAMNKVGFKKLAGKFPKNTLQLSNAMRTAGDRVSRATMQSLQSYAMTNTESNQIGEQVQAEVLDNSIDKIAGFSMEKEMAAIDDPSKSDVVKRIMAKDSLNKKREKWALENKKAFNELVLTARYAKEQAVAVNDYAFFANLTSAGLFVKSRPATKLLKNPYSFGGFKRGAWGLVREGFQEGVVEEGLINGYAESFGKSAGRGMFLSMKGYQDKDMKSSQFGESVILGMAMGAIQHGVMEGYGSIESHKEFKKQQESVNKLNELMDYNNKNTQLLVSNLSLQQQAQLGALMLAHQAVGDEESAAQIGDALIANKAVEAAENGTSGVMINALKTLQQHDEITEEEKQGLDSAIQLVEKVAHDYNKYSNRSDVKDITLNRLNHHLNSEILEESDKEVANLELAIEDEKRAKIKAQYDKALKKYNENKLHYSGHHIMEGADPTSTEKPGQKPFMSIFEFTEKMDKTKPDGRKKVSKALKEAKKKNENIREQVNKLEDEFSNFFDKKYQMEKRANDLELFKIESIQNMTLENNTDVKRKLKKLGIFDENANKLHDQKLVKLNAQKVAAENEAAKKAAAKAAAAKAAKVVTPVTPVTPVNPIVTQKNKMGAAAKQEGKAKFRAAKLITKPVVTKKTIKATEAPETPMPTEEPANLQNEKPAVQEQPKEPVQAPEAPMPTSEGPSDSNLAKVKKIEISEEDNAMSALDEQGGIPLPFDFSDIELAPIDVSPDDPDHVQAVNGLEDAIRAIQEQMKKNAGGPISLEEVFGLFASTVGFHIAERNFNFFIKAFQNVTGKKLSETKISNLYNEFFSALEKFKNIGIAANEASTKSGPASTADVIEANDDIESETAKEETKENDNNLEPIVLHLRNGGGDDVKIARGVHKMPFLGVKYATIIVNGKERKQDESAELNRDGDADIDFILDPNRTKVGTKFEAHVPDNWKDLNVTLWDGSQKKVVTMEAWMKNKGIPLDENKRTAEQQEMFENKVPIVLLNSEGNVVAYAVHDVDWWNEHNVASFKGAIAETSDGNYEITNQAAKERQAAVIQEGREKTIAARKRILNGENDLYVQEVSGGVGRKLPKVVKDVPVTQPVAKANPNAKITYMSPLGLVEEKADEREDDVVHKNNVINYDAIVNGAGSDERGNINNHAFMLFPVGKNKDGVEQYAAVKLFVNKNQKLQEKARNSLKILYSASFILNNKGNYDAETVADAQKIADQVKDKFKIDITNVNYEDGKMQYIGIGLIKGYYPGRVTNTAEDGTKSTEFMMLIEGSEKRTAPLIMVDPETNEVSNYVSEHDETKTGYEAFLGDVMETDRQFFRVETPDGPHYTNNPQPIIELGPNKPDGTKKVDSAKPIPSPKLKKSVEEVKAEIDNKIETTKQEQNTDAEITSTVSGPIILGGSALDVRSQMAFNINGVNFKSINQALAYRALADDMMDYYNRIDGYDSIDNEDLSIPPITIHEQKVLVKKERERILNEGPDYNYNLIISNQRLPFKTVSENSISGISTSSKKTLTNSQIYDVLKSAYDQNVGRQKILVDTKGVLTHDGKFQTDPWTEKPSELEQQIDNSLMELRDYYDSQTKMSVLPAENETKQEKQPKTPPKAQELSPAIEQGPIDTTLNATERVAVVNFLFHNLLSELSKVKDLNTNDVALFLESAIDLFISNNKDVTPEMKAKILANKDRILGTGKHSDTVGTLLSEINLFLNEDISIEDELEAAEIEDENVMEKHFSDNGLARSVQASFSSTMKMFLAGIKDPRANSSEFAIPGLPAYLSPTDVFIALEMLLSDSPNDIESFRQKVKDKIAQNPEEFGFIKSILEKFENLTEDNKELQNKILYTLYQSKHEMFYVQYSMHNGKTILRTNNANSKDPMIAKKISIHTDFKQLPFVQLHQGDVFTINSQKANESLSIAKKIILLNRNDSTDQEIADAMRLLGLSLKTKTITDLRTGKITGMQWGDNDILARIVRNFEKATIKAAENSSFRFSVKETRDKINGHPIFRDNNTFMKKLMVADVNNTFNPVSSIYTGGKTVNAFSQPNLGTKSAIALANKNSSLRKRLKTSLNAMDDFILNLTENNTKARNAISVSYVALSALKKQGAKTNSNRNKITDQSSSDYETTVLGFFQHSGDRIKNKKLEKDGLILRVAKMLFPTISDTSQMMLFNVPVLDIRSNNVTFTEEEGKFRLGIPVVNHLFNQLVVPDIRKILMALQTGDTTDKENTFLALPGLNSIEFKDEDGNSIKLLEYLHQLPPGTDLDSALTPRADYAIKKFIHELVEDSVAKRIRVEDGELQGKWIDEGYFDGISTEYLDSSYLESKGSEDMMENVMLAAIDFVVNDLSTKATIQNLIIGDLSNYYKGSDFYTAEDGTKDYSKNVPFDEIHDANKKMGVNLSKRIKAILSPGNVLANSMNKHYSQLYVDDKVSSSDRLEYIVNLYYDTSAKDIAEIRKFKEVENRLYATTKAGKKNPTLQKEYDTLKSALKDKYKNIDEYFDIETTDGMELTTWQEHLNIIWGQGRISEADYNRIHERLTDQTENGVNPNNKLDSEDRKILFHTHKPLHAGLYHDDIHDSNGNLIPGQTKQRFVYIKTSSIPMLPEATFGKEMDNLRKNAENIQKSLNYGEDDPKQHNTLRISFNSGNKVGRPGTKLDAGILFGQELDNDVIDGLKATNLVTLDRQYFSIQLDKPPKTQKNIKAGRRDEVTTSIQQEKILLSNGINKIKEKIFPVGYLSERTLTDNEIEVIDGKISGEDIAKIYYDLNFIKFESLNDKFYSKLNLEKHGVVSSTDIESIENLAKSLSPRLNNPQDKEMLTIVYTAMTEIDGKMVERQFFKYELGSRTPIKAEFRLPIWLSPNSHKFESVMNSFVTNTISKTKTTGFSAPVASETGWNLTGEISPNLDIVYTEKFKGKLEATVVDGELRAAQVLVPSKFRRKYRDENGKTKYELIDIRTYVKDGVLDTSRIPEELLKYFSFRVPTSSHQSGVVIEVVGFLPENMGDTMVVPKDHLVQLGEDFDIDVRTVYGKNYYEKNGKLIVITRNEIEESLKDLQENALPKFLNNLHGLTQHSSQDVVDKAQEILDGYAHGLITVADIMRINGAQEQIDYIKSTLELYAIENDLTNLYHSVYESSDPKIQGIINKVLSTQNAANTISAIKKATNKSSDKFFTVHDYYHQRNTMEMGNAGKLGTAIHSRWVAYNGLIQHIPDEFGVIRVSQPFTFGEFIPTGVLGITNFGKINGVEQRTSNDVNMENQNVSVDNQNLQLMGYRNENQFTMNAFALMCNMGVGDGKTSAGVLHHPSLFIAQPILKDYVRLMELYSSETAEYIHDVESKVLAELRELYPVGPSYADSKGRLKQKIKKNVDALNTTATLLHNIGNPNNLNQLAVLETFLELNNAASEIGDMFALASIGDRGVGISAFDPNQALEDLLSMEEKYIDNAMALLGEVVYLETEDDIDNPPDRFIPITMKDGVIIGLVPSTVTGIKFAQTLSANLDTYANLFPHDSKVFKDLVSSILDSSFIDDNRFHEQKMKYSVANAIKDFIYSYDKLSVFDDDVDKVRKHLFFDRDGNKSLAWSLQYLKREQHPLMKKPFFRDLIMVLGDGHAPSIINFNLNDKSSFYKSSIHNTLLMLSENHENIVAGVEYTYSDLAKELVQYSMLSNQENGAVGFRNQIPLELFDKYNVLAELSKYGKMESTVSTVLFMGKVKLLDSLVEFGFVEGNSSHKLKPTANIDMVKRLVTVINKDAGREVFRLKNGNLISDNFESLTSVFRKQYFQHNPTDSAKVPKKVLGGQKNDDVEYFVSPTITNPKTGSETPIYTSPYVHIKSNKEILLFELRDGVYYLIPQLGQFGYNEYKPARYDNETNIKEESILSVKSTKEELTDLIKKENRKRAIMAGSQSALRFIASNKSKIGEAASILKDMLPNTDIILGPLGSHAGFYFPKGLGNVTRNGVFYQEGKIYMNTVLLNSEHKENMELTILEESIHAATSDKIRSQVKIDGLNSDGTSKFAYTGEKMSSAVIELVQLHKAAEKVLLAKYEHLGPTFGQIRAAIKSKNQNVKNQYQELYPEMYSAAYRLSSLSEFAMVPFADESVTRILNNVKYAKTNKNILQRIKSVLSKIVVSLLDGGVKNSIAKETATAVLTIIDESVKRPDVVDPKKIKIVPGQTKADIAAEALLEGEDGGGIDLGKFGIDFSDVELDNSPVIISNDLDFVQIKKCN